MSQVATQNSNKNKAKNSAGNPAENKTATQTMQTPIDTAQTEQNRQARTTALAAVSPALNLAAPGVEYQSSGRLLILGAEHQIRLAAERLGDSLELCALVTEAMPQQVSPQMEAAATLVPELKLYRLKLLRVSGYLGAFQVNVEIEGQVQNLAKLAAGVECFDLVLDLGMQPQLTASLKPAGYFAPDDPASLTDALVQLPSMKGGFEKPRYFQIDSDRCAHSASDLAGCTRCLDVCPADAISVQNATVQIDAHLCHGAGGCASACPTSAIRYGFPQPSLLLDSLQRLLSGYVQAGGQTPHLLLHDAQSAETCIPQLLQALPGHYLPLQIEEIGSAGMEVWLSAIALGAVGVSMLVNEELPESMQQALDREIDSSNRMLQGLALSARVALVDTARLVSQSKVVPPAADVEPVAQLALLADKREQISLALTHLYQQQAQQSGLPSMVAMQQGAPFGSVEMRASDCTLCMACSAICPSGALSSAQDTPQLSFTEDACVQCGLCVQACPEQVLSLEPRLLLDPEQRTQPRVLKEEQPFCCVSCGEPFATQSVVALMISKLTGHSMFDEEGLKRLKMCQDCRVIDIVKTDPGTDLFEYAKGREQHSEELNLAAAVEKPQTDGSTAVEVK